MTAKQLLQVLWRRKPVVAGIIILTVMASVLYLKERAPSYRSSAIVQLAESSTSGGQSTTAAAANLKLVTGRPVAEAAAAAVHAPDPAALAGGISATIDITYGTITITATEPSSSGAQVVANAFANSFVTYLKNQAGGSVASLKQQQAAAYNELTRLNQQAGTGSTVSPANQALITAASQNYSTITTQLAQAQNAPVPATVLNPADPGTSNRSSKKIVGIALLVGLLAGCGVALIVEQLDTRVREEDDVTEGGNLGLLAELPVDPDARRRSTALPTMERPQSPFSEGVRELRSALQVLLADKPCPVIVITSPDSGDGKTALAANLAVSWALSGKRTVVVSGDIRRNHLDEVFSDKVPATGLATLLEAEFARLPVTPGSPEEPEGAEDDHDRQLVWGSLWLTDVDRLMLLPAGTTTKDPADLLASPSTGYVLDQLRQLADVVIIDTPPVLPVADAPVWSSVADGVVLVVRAGKTQRAQMERACHRITAAGGNVLGTALNRSRTAVVASYGNYSGAWQVEGRRRTGSSSPVASHGAIPGAADSDRVPEASRADGLSGLPVEPS